MRHLFHLVYNDYNSRRRSWHSLRTARPGRQTSQYHYRESTHVWYPLFEFEMRACSWSCSIDGIAADVYLDRITRRSIHVSEMACDLTWFSTYSYGRYICRLPRSITCYYMSTVFNGQIWIWQCGVQVDRVGESYCIWVGFAEVSWRPTKLLHTRRYSTQNHIVNMFQPFF